MQVRLQLQQGAARAGGDVYYHSMLHGLQRVAREEGAYWLWRPGVEATWLRAFSSTGLRIGLYNSVKNNIQALVSPGHDENMPIPLAVKVLSGVNSLEPSGPRGSGRPMPLALGIPRRTARCHAARPDEEATPACSLAAGLTPACAPPPSVALCQPGPRAH
jgi:hypothetical protein